jgi:hypothetical protein
MDVDTRMGVDRNPWAALAIIPVGILQSTAAGPAAGSKGRLSAGPDVIDPDWEVGDDIAAKVTALARYLGY